MHSSCHLIFAEHSANFQKNVYYMKSLCTPSPVAFFQTRHFKNNEKKNQCLNQSLPKMSLKFNFTLFTGSGLYLLHEGVNNGANE